MLCVVWCGSLTSDAVVFWRGERDGVVSSGNRSNDGKGGMCDSDGVMDGGCVMGGVSVGVGVDVGATDGGDSTDAGKTIFIRPLSLSH